MSCRYIDDYAWLTCVTYFDGECAYCGRSNAALTADHLVAKANGGTDTPSNIVPACEECNEAKGAMDWRDFIMGLNNFSQERMNRIFNWRRICKQAKIGVRK